MIEWMVRVSIIFKIKHYIKEVSMMVCSMAKEELLKMAKRLLGIGNKGCMLEIMNQKTLILIIKIKMKIKMNKLIQKIK